MATNTDQEMCDSSDPPTPTCFLCKKDHLPLVDPLKATNKSQPVGYQTLAENLKMLWDLDAMPFNLDMFQLDDGDGIAEMLRKNHAQWHKNCYSMCSMYRVERAKAKKWKATGMPNLASASPVKGKLRGSFSSQSAPATESDINNPLRKCQMRKTNFTRPQPRTAMSISRELPLKCAKQGC